MPLRARVVCLSEAESGAGVTKAFIPKANVHDLRDVADEVKEKIEIIPVESVADLLAETGVLDKLSEKCTA